MPFIEFTACAGYREIRQMYIVYRRQSHQAKGNKTPGINHNAEKLHFYKWALLQSLCHLKPIRGISSKCYSYTHLSAQGNKSHGVCERRCADRANFHTLCAKRCRNIDARYLVGEGNFRGDIQSAIAAEQTNLAACLTRAIIHNTAATRTSNGIIY
jgi:hypothetical protein